MRNLERAKKDRSRLEAFLEGEDRRSMRRRKRGARHRIAVPIIIACAVMAALVALDAYANAGRIYRGVEAGPVEVGGMTREEAQAAVGEHTGSLRELRLSGPEEVVFNAEEMGVNFDVGGTVQAAYSVGRSGNLIERLEQRLQASWGTVVVEPVVNYDPRVARVEIERLAQRFDREPVEGSIEISGSEVEVGESREGYRLNTGATLENVNRAVSSMSGEADIVGERLTPEVSTEEARGAGERARRAMSGPVTLAAEGQRWTLSPAEIGQVLSVREQEGSINVAVDRDAMRQSLASVYATLTSEAVEANFVVEGSTVSVTPSQNGMQVREDEFFSMFQDGIFDGRRSYEVPVSVQEPELTTGEAEAMKPTELLGEYATNYLTYDDTDGRVKNLQIASNAVSGTLLAPGEVFSFNELAAPLDYEESKVIIDGRVDTADGGGLCQVSSTLYMAANYAGLDVIERQPHYAELPYIRPGFDATVWFGAIDMKFQNDTSGYVLVQEWVDTSTGNVNARIFGRPTGRDVEMSSEKISETTDDEGNPVTKWVTYQRVVENGEVVFDDVLHTDTYKHLKPEEATDEERPPN